MLCAFAADGSADELVEPPSGAPLSAASERVVFDGHDAPPENGEAAGRAQPAHFFC